MFRLFVAGLAIILLIYVNYSIACVSRSEFIVNNQSHTIYMCTVTFTFNSLNRTFH